MVNSYGFVKSRFETVRLNRGFETMKSLEKHEKRKTNSSSDFISLSPTRVQSDANSSQEKDAQGSREVHQ